MLRSHYHDQRKVSNRGLHRGLIAALVSAQFEISVGIIVLIAEHFWTVHFFLRLARLIFDRNHRIRSYCIVSKRHTSHLILLPNRVDRDRYWTRQNPISVEMSCDLVRSAPICDALSGPFAQYLSRVTHKQVRVDTRKCE